MSVAYSSVVSENVIEKKEIHQKLSVFERHDKKHGSSPSLKQLFDSARNAASSEHDRDVISWLESAINSRESGDDGAVVLSTPPFSPPSHNQASHMGESVSSNHQKQHDGGEIFVSPVFFPSEESFHHLVGTLDNAQQSLDICVYTITDDQISAAIIRAVDRGVQVRIITDDEKAEDLGSDAKRLAREYNVPVRVDGSPSYMHHKFAVIDDKLVINGSYNWTKGARFQNREDLTLTNSAKAVHAFKGEFERLWREFEAHQM
ncbi:hypothetical protein BGZ99_003297 [Dissophora globulifera]|uniref:Mitochondrial cardiolipin hydrolase n=1 Tax=Dissophora globulifera TaxID=979702 RepID=A0A9P6V0D8_9FUNG|nr:hypothetical protein BGZ99_003297 [Dissophora globulifera]